MEHDESILTIEREKLEFDNLTINLTRLEVTRDGNVLALFQLRGYGVHIKQNG